MADNAVVRTGAELTQEQFNYFLAFNIPLTETDLKKIETAIKKGLSDTSGSVVTRRRKELTTDINEVMLNDATFDGSKYTPNTGARKKEAEAAKKIKLESAKVMVNQICRSRKVLHQSELDQIFKTANKPVECFSKDEFDKEVTTAVKAAGVKVINNVDTTFPFSDYKNADGYLNAIGKKNLFEFLGVDERASVQDISAKKTQIYSDGQKTNDLKKKQSISSLCGIVDKIFVKAGAQGIKNYGYYVATKESVWAEFDNQKKFNIKDLPMDAYIKYVQTICDTAKVKDDAAEKMVADACLFYGMTISGEGSTDLEPCPFCNKLYQKGARTCPHCGKSLVLSCWNCGAVRAVSLTVCPSCGATKQGQVEFTNACKSLDNLLSKPVVEISDLEAGLKLLENVVPDYKTKGDSSKIREKVSFYEKQLGDKRETERKYSENYREKKKEIDNYRAQRKLRMALSLASRLPMDFPGYNATLSQTMIADLTKEIDRAKGFFLQAQQCSARNDLNGAIRNAVQVLKICDDYDEARQILQKNPPKPISGISASVTATGVKLEWTIGLQQEEATFTIVKKIGAAPTTPQDGSVVVSGLRGITFYEDTAIVPATVYYYGVFVERLGTKSPIIATRTPVSIYKNVSGLKQEIVEAGVKVSWEAPLNVKEIEVWKNAGSVAPTKSGEGTKVDCTKEGFFDLSAKSTCAYLILCKYAGPSGPLYTKGVTIVCKPFEVIVPLKNVKIESAENDKYLLSADRGYNGKIQVYYAETVIRALYGKPQRFLDFGELCSGLIKVETKEAPTGEIEFTLPKNKILQVYPVVVTEQQFIIAEPILTNTMEGLKCTHSVSGGTVTISGTLNPAAKAVVAKISENGYAKTINDDGELFKLDKETFLKTGKVAINVKSGVLSYITLFVQFETNNVATYSPGVIIEPPIDFREPKQVYYWMQIKPTKTAGILTIGFKSDEPVTVPPFALVYSLQKTPKTISEGRLCDNFKALTLKKGWFKKEYTGQYTYEIDPRWLNARFSIFQNGVSEDNVKLIAIDLV